MNCPYCAGESKVVDSRPISDGIRRRRQCLLCGRRFTTIEKAVAADIRVLKAGGRPPEDFRAEKILLAISRVSKGRPIKRTEIEAAARTIEAEIVDSGKTAIGTAEVARMVLSQLAKLDELAYSRFASNYLGREGWLNKDTKEDDTEKVLQQYSLFED